MGAPWPTLMKEITTRDLFCYFREIPPGDFCIAISSNRLPQRAIGQSRRTGSEPDIQTILAWTAALTLAHHIADLVSLLDQLNLRKFVIVGQDWGGPQGVGAALQRIERLSAIVLMNTWLFTDHISPFHASPKPWMTWHAPLIGQFFMKRLKVLSHHGPSVTTVRGMSHEEARAYHHVFDEPDSDHVVLTWPRTIPMREGDRGYADMKAIERRLPELGDIPVSLLWAPEDEVFPISFARPAQRVAATRGRPDYLRRGAPLFAGRPGC